MAVSPLAAAVHLSGWFASLALLLMMLGWYAVLGPLTSMLATFVPGRAGAIAVGAINMCAISGGFAGPYFMGWMRETTGGYAWGIGLLSLPCAAAALGIFWLMQAERTANSSQ
jgi:ACS family tartrate transporter-like MFS transporter